MPATATTAGTGETEPSLAEQVQARARQVDQAREAREQREQQSREQGGCGECLACSRGLSAAWQCMGCSDCHHFFCECPCIGCGNTASDCACCEDCEHYPCRCSHCYECDQPEPVCRRDRCGECECCPCECCYDCGTSPCQCSDYDGDRDENDMPYGNPELVFKGDGPAYYGMEIEISTDYTRDAVEAVADECGRDAWCKPDGSVDGFELVTHPMSYDWAMRNFKWEVLGEVRRRASAYIDASTNGIHVHVSRAAFSSPAHLYRFMKFVYRNQGDVERIARRKTSWGKFTNASRPGHFAHIMKLKAREKGLSTYSREWERISQADTTTQDRYSAVNTCNRDTLEVRVFASTLDVAEAKSALQLVAGSVEYTRQLTAADVAQRNGWSWQAFREWLGQPPQAEKYPDLLKLDKVLK